MIQQLDVSNMTIFCTTTNQGNLVCASQMLFFLSHCLAFPLPFPDDTRAILVQRATLGVAFVINEGGLGLCRQRGRNLEIFHG